MDVKLMQYSLATHSNIMMCLDLGSLVLLKPCLSGFVSGAPLGFELPAQLQTAAQQRQMASASGRQQKAPHQKSRLWNMNSFSFLGIWKHAEHTTQSEGHV